MSRLNEYLEAVKNQPQGKIKIGTADFVILANATPDVEGKKMKISQDDIKFCCDRIMEENKCDLTTAKKMFNTALECFKKAGSIIVYGIMDATDDKDIELFRKNLAKSKFFYAVSDYGNTLVAGTKTKIQSDIIDFSSGNSFEEITKAKAEELIQSNIDED